MRARLACTVVALAALAPARALADVTIDVRPYGFVNAEVERVWAPGGATPYQPRFRVSDGNSRLGVAGAVAITKNLTAHLQVEGALNGFEQGGTNDSGAPPSLVSRNTFVGIEYKPFGRILAGNNDSAYRSLVGSGGAMGGNLGLTVLGLDLWNNTSAQLSGGVASLFGRGEARYMNSIHYVSPVWQAPALLSSFQLSASYAFDETLSRGGSRDRFSVAGLYKLGDFSLGVALDSQSNTGVDGDVLLQGGTLRTAALNGASTQYYKAIVSYVLPTSTYVGIGFELSNYGYESFRPPSSTDYTVGIVTGSMQQIGDMLSVAQPIGKLTLMASGGVLWNATNSIFGPGSNHRATQYSLGAKYDFSEHFGTYVYYTAIRNKLRQDINLGTPIYSNDLGAPGARLAPGDSPHALGIGAIARF